MIGWLRARMHLFPLILLPAALVWLGIDWALSEPTGQETLVTAILGGGGLVLWALKWGLMRRQKDSLDD